MESSIMTVKNVEFKAEGDTLIKISYIGDRKKVEYIDTLSIPSYINGQKISKINKKVLSGDFTIYAHIHIFIIPQGIDEIEHNAFEFLNADTVIWPSSCKKISNLCFLNSKIERIQNIQDVEEIEARAFWGSENLKEFTWPEKCSTIPSECFLGCSNLEEFSFKHINSIQKLAFFGSGLKKALDTLNIQDIGVEAFRECKDLKEFIWPSKCLIIPKRCFMDSWIEKISNIQDVIEIREAAFYGCNMLKEFIWPPKCPEIPNLCFKKCERLKEVSFKGVNSIGKEAFSHCSNLKEIIWPEKCTNIPTGCFQNSGLETISRLKRVERIERNAFYKCPIQTLDLSESMQYNAGVEVDDFAFKNIEKITFIT